MFLKNRYTRFLACLMMLVCPDKLKCTSTLVNIAGTLHFTCFAVSVLIFSGISVLSVSLLVQNLLMVLFWIKLLIAFRSLTHCSIVCFSLPHFCAFFFNIVLMKETQSSPSLSFSFVSIPHFFPRNICIKTSPKKIFCYSLCFVLLLTSLYTAYG